MGKYAVGRYGWRNLFGLEACFDEFAHRTFDRFLEHHISGYTLSVGCGSDMKGQVRLDIEPTEATNIIGDACHLPFKDKSFDTVILIGVLHHIPNYEQAMKEAVRVCKKAIAGREPNIFHPALCLFRYYLGLGGERSLYIPKLKRMYEKEGFRLVEEEWLYGLKFLGTLTKRHDFLIRFDRIIPRFLRASWSYAYVRDEETCPQFHQEGQD